MDGTRTAGSIEEPLVSQELTMDTMEGDGVAAGVERRVVRATVVQASTVFYNTPATMDKAERLLREAAALGSQLVVFPEAFIGGYPRGASFGVVVGSRSEEGKEEFQKYHAAAIQVPGEETRRLASLSQALNLFIVMGAIERAGGTLYCSVLFFDPSNALVACKRKLMPTAAERYIWGQGDGSNLPVFSSPSVGRIGAAICWENRMPLLRMALYAKGIEVYCAPTADSRDSWQSTISHIALEGGCFVLSANQFCRRRDYPHPPAFIFATSRGGEGNEPAPESVVCMGGSAIVSPSGIVLAGPNFEGEALLTADLDLSSIVKAKFEFDVTGHYARPDVFSLTVNEAPRDVVKFF